MCSGVRSERFVGSVRECRVMGSICSFIEPLLLQFVDLFSLLPPQYDSGNWPRRGSSLIGQKNLTSDGVVEDLHQLMIRFHSRSSQLTVKLLTMGFAYPCHLLLRRVQLWQLLLLRLLLRLQHSALLLHSRPGRPAVLACLPIPCCSV